MTPEASAREELVLVALEYGGPLPSSPVLTHDISQPRAKLTAAFQPVSLDMSVNLWIVQVLWAASWYY